MRDHHENSSCEDPCCTCCIRFREAWTAGSIYRPGDAVPYNGSSYAAIHWNQNDPPPSPNWALIASKGDTGPAGPQGPAGPVGPKGPAGPTSMGRTYTHYVTGEYIFNPSGYDFAHFNLPPGEYVIWAMIPISNTDTDPQTWTVQLVANNGATVDGGVTGRIVPLEESSMEVVTVVATCKAPAGTTITFTGFGFNIVLFPNVGGKTCTIVAMETQLIP